MKKRNSILLSAIGKAGLVFGLATFSFPALSEEDIDLAQPVPSCVHVCYEEKSGKARRGCPSICQAQEDTCAAEGGSFEFQADQYVCATSENIGIAKK